MERGIVIVGGGLAGAVAAESYRKAGGTDPVTIISADSDLPVHRPPLSKEYLRGDETLEKVFVHPAEFYADQGIDVRLDSRVAEIDRDARELVLADGERVGYDTLVLATGARPRRLPIDGGDLPGVFYLRSLCSAQELQAAYGGARRAVIIGAGFIGMEVAATLTQRGINCTVVEMAPRVWPAIVPSIASEFFQRYFGEHGVSFRLDVGVQAIEGDGRAERVLLANGEVLPADIVIAGVGAILNTDLAERAGLRVDRGVEVDEHLRTSDPHIYAIGDIASFPTPSGAHLHLEHWDNAVHQGRTLGQTLAGNSTSFEHVPYFFSDLFDLSLNMIGHSSGWDDAIIRGNPDENRFTLVYLKDGMVDAALMVNDDEHFDAWTRLVEGQHTFHQSLIDPRQAPLPAAG